MPRTFSELRKRMSPERQRRVEGRVQLKLLRMSFQEIRKNVTSLTQHEVADLLDRREATISEIEKREDMLLSTLAEYV